MRKWWHGLRSSFLVGTSLAAGTQTTFGFEPGFVVNTTPGITSGIPTGANPPAGFYFLNLANGGRDALSGGGSSAGLSGFKSESATELPVLLWSTPWTVLGASWAMLVAAPVTKASVFDGAATFAHASGFHNPGLAPMTLSWNLGNGLFAKLGATFWFPIGTVSLGPANNGHGNIGAPYWTIEPHLAVSYLANDLNLTANLIYGVSTKNTYSHVTNGQSLTIDFTATKKFQGFEIGPVGYLSSQVTSDSGCEAFYGTGVCARGTKAGIGGLIGYNFGAVSTSFAVTNSVYVRNSYDGWRMWSTLSYRLWAPQEAPSARPIRTGF
jgi:hypothetical protein